MTLRALHLLSGGNPTRGARFIKPVKVTKHRESRVRRSFLDAAKDTRHGGGERGRERKRSAGGRPDERRSGRPERVREREQ